MKCLTMTIIAASILFVQIVVFSCAWFIGYFKYMDVGYISEMHELHVKDSSQEAILITMHKLIVNTVLREKLPALDELVEENFYNVSRSECPLGTRKEKICRYIKDTINIKTVTELFRYTDEKFGMHTIFENDVYKNCAIVTNAGSLLDSNLGAFIDTHDFVLRFNDAPTNEYSDDVGKKTSMRIVNSQVVSRPEFDFADSPLYKNIRILIWDPSKYSEKFEDWLHNPEYNYAINYIRYKNRDLDAKIDVLNPEHLWKLWDHLQCMFADKAIPPTPPSSAFIGLSILIPRCSVINIFEYIPSRRITQKCHYYNVKDVNKMCTYGGWHPLAAEKLFALKLNKADDKTVYNDGYITIMGYNNSSTYCK